MRILSAALMATIIVPTAAFAGPIEVPHVPPPVVVAPAVSWDGFYAGLSYSATTGDIDFIPAPAQALDDGELYSLFAGYRVQNGNLVYGGELGVHVVDEIAVTGFTGVSALDGTFIDARATLGYAFGSLLVYGAVGYSMGTYDDFLAGTGDEFDLSGYNYGIGAEYQISERFVLGLDYTARMLEGDNPLNAAQSAEVDLNTISLRASFRF